MHQREDPFGLRHVAQSLGSEVAQDGAPGKRSIQLIDRATGKKGLPSIGESLEP
jgi:hypothetical protein